MIPPSPATALESSCYVACQFQWSTFLLHSSRKTSSGILRAHTHVPRTPHRAATPSHSRTESYLPSLTCVSRFAIHRRRCDPTLAIHSTVVCLQLQFDHTRLSGPSPHSGFERGPQGRMLHVGLLRVFPSWLLPALSQSGFESGASGALDNGRVAPRDRKSVV